MSRGPKANRKSGPPATPSASAATVSKQFIETLRSLHVSPHVLDAAEKAVRDREAVTEGAGEPAPARS